MPNTVISVEHLSKHYDLGVIGTGTLTRDFERWWARARGKPDPYSPVAQDHNYRYRGDESILALDDVSFTVQQGEALGIIGRNGAGKSTLLKILSRVTAPTSGVVKVKGRIGSLLEVGTGFHPELTGRENVYLNGAILGMKKVEVARKFDEIVAFSGVEKFIDTPVKRYSSGMYVRLAFAVAAHLDPEILIVDEVLAVGDAEFQKKCLGKMGDVADEGRTVLFVSHNMGSVKHLCQSGIVINNGKISYSGDVEGCVEYYLQANRSKSEKIIDHITHINDVITIKAITINEQPFDSLSVSRASPNLRLCFEGYLNRDLPVNLELRFKDLNGLALGFFSPGHNSGNTPVIPKGDFLLSWNCRIPDNILRGDYLLEIALTNPDKNWWLKIPSAVILTIDGVIDNKNERGWMMLS